MGTDETDGRIRSRSEQQSPARLDEQSERSERSDPSDPFAHPFGTMKSVHNMQSAGNNLDDYNFGRAMASMPNVGAGMDLNGFNGMNGFNGFESISSEIKDLGVDPNDFNINMNMNMNMNMSSNLNVNEVKRPQLRRSMSMVNVFDVYRVGKKGARTKHDLFSNRTKAHIRAMVGGVGNVNENVFVSDSKKKKGMNRRRQSQDDWNIRDIVSRDSNLAKTYGINTKAAMSFTQSPMLMPQLTTTHSSRGSVLLNGLNCLSTLGTKPVKKRNKKGCRRMNSASPRDIGMFDRNKNHFSIGTGPFPYTTTSSGANTIASVGNDSMHFGSLSGLEFDPIRPNLSQNSQVSQLSQMSQISQISQMSRKSHKIPIMSQTSHTTPGRTRGLKATTTMSSASNGSSTSRSHRSSKKICCKTPNSQTLTNRALSLKNNVSNPCSGNKMNLSNSAKRQQFNFEPARLGNVSNIYAHDSKNININNVNINQNNNGFITPNSPAEMVDINDIFWKRSDAKMNCEISAKNGMNGSIGSIGSIGNVVKKDENGEHSSGLASSMPPVGMNASQSVMDPMPSMPLSPNVPHDSDMFWEHRQPYSTQSQSVLMDHEHKSVHQSSALGYLMETCDNNNNVTKDPNECQNESEIENNQQSDQSNQGDLVDVTDEGEDCCDDGSNTSQVRFDSNGEGVQMCGQIGEANELPQNGFNYDFGLGDKINGTIGEFFGNGSEILMDTADENEFDSDSSLDLSRNASRHRRNFGIHPIMVRIANESLEVKRYFMDYLRNLIEITCHRISQRSRGDDKCDNIYDIDTPSGVFVWKNELRHEWDHNHSKRPGLSKIGTRGLSAFNRGTRATRGMHGMNAIHGMNRNGAERRVFMNSDEINEIRGRKGMNGINGVNGLNGERGHMEGTEDKTNNLPEKMRLGSNSVSSVSVSSVASVSSGNSSKSSGASASSGASGGKGTESDDESQASEINLSNFGKKEKGEKGEKGGDRGGERSVGTSLESMNEMNEDDEEDQDEPFLFDPDFEQFGNIADHVEHLK